MDVRHAAEPQARRFGQELAGFGDGAPHRRKTVARLRGVGQEAPPVGRRTQERQPSQQDAKVVQQGQGPSRQHVEKTFHS
jgi:hypothetical protein